MTKVVLVEAHPLIRLGLHQLLGAMAESWDVLALDARSISEFAYLECEVELVILGMAAEPDDGWRTLADVERILNPRRTLLLSEPTTAWQPPHGQSCASVYGCISRTAPVEVVEAAIRLGIAREHMLNHPPLPASRASAARAAAPLVTALPLDLPRRPPAASAPTAAPAPAAPPVLAPEPAPAPPLEGVGRNTPDAVAGAQLLNVTPRQYEVLALLARGYPIKTVSRMLNISTATAKAHASTLYQRLRVNSKGEAVYAARQRGVYFD